MIEGLITRALTLGGGGDADLHDKEVELSTSDITGSQTAIFVYNPQNEQPTPWDGYSLFTIDLSGVKEDIEELQQQVSDAEACRQQVISALQEYDPDYDPQSGECPASKVEDLVEAWQDDEDEIEACHDCKDAVVAAMQAIDPNYVLPASGCPEDIPQKAYEKGKEDAPDEYTFPQDPIDPTKPTLEDVTKLTATDPVSIEGNSYYFVYKSRLTADRGETWTDYSIYDIVTNVDTDPYYASYTCEAYVYDKATSTLQSNFVLLDSDGGSIGRGGYFKVTSLQIDYTNKTLTTTWEKSIWGTVSTGTKVNNISAYLDTTSPNPRYTVTKS